MARGAQWGHAPIQSFGETITPRAAWAQFRHAADIWGRDPEIAAAMVRASRDIGELGAKGRPITLYPTTAIQTGYADLIADSYPEILKGLHIAGDLAHVRVGLWSSLIRILVHPWITVLLLAIGVSLLIREAMTWRTFGVTGSIGLGFVVLVLFANIACGGSWVGFALFVIGILSLFAEIYLAPGLGLPTVVGIICIFLGIFLGIGGGRATILPAFVGAILTSVVGLIAFFTCLPKAHTWRNLLQVSRDDRDLGIVAPNDFTGYLGVVGLALTELRPKGIAAFAGSRIDVTADGDFIRQGASIEVTRIEGSQVFVREVQVAAPRRRR